MSVMGSTRSGGPDQRDTGTWTTETLPLSVRKELLERQLDELGFRRKAAHGGATREVAEKQQQQGESHPKAGGEGSSHGG
jgi:hypothetical protein